MEQPGRLPLSGDRWTPFVRTLEFRGVDLTDAVFAAQIRLTPDTPGTPLVSLGTVSTASAQGVRLISFATVDGVDVSVVGIRINETTMEGLPAADEIGADLELAWDMHITPAGALKQRWLYGPFTLRAGVTQ